MSADRVSSKTAGVIEACVTRGDSSPGVHDVLDRLTELRDAAESPAKADAVRSLTDLIQEKALG